LFRTEQFRFHLLRNVMHFVGVAGWFYAISRMNLSTGMALQFTVPLFTILLAIIFLREKSRPRAMGRDHHRVCRCDGYPPPRD
jgi:drug/metabolite transporter (DMT)-like permease